MFITLDEKTFFNINNVKSISLNEKSLTVSINGEIFVVSKEKIEEIKNTLKSFE